MVVIYKSKMRLKIEIDMENLKCWILNWKTDLKLLTCLLTIDNLIQFLYLFLK